MGPVLSKANRLFWLGRYNERVFTSIRYVMKVYDRMIDGDPPDFADICKRLEMPFDYPDAQSFFRAYAFDMTNPDSIARSADSMLGNGMVLRETISTDTLSYLQMAVNALNMAAASKSPLVELQWVLDDIMAFRGSFEDFIVDDTIRAIMRCGISVERISMYGRLEIHENDSALELKKLLNRISRSKLPIRHECQEVILEKALNTEHTPSLPLYQCVEQLFIV